MTEQRRWVMFLIKPDDLLDLLRRITDENATLFASRFPPDTRVHGAFHDAARGYLGVMLESQFFDEVAVTREDGQWSGPFNELIFTLEEVDDASEVPDDNAWETVDRDDAAGPTDNAGRVGPSFGPPDGEHQHRWQMLRVQPAQILQVLQLLAERPADLKAPAFPPDARVVNAWHNGDQDTFDLILQSQFFDPVRPIQDGDSVTLTLPEQRVTINVIPPGP